MTLTRPAGVADTADVDPSAVIGDGTRVWHLAQVREAARVGRECVVGRGAYVGPGVVVGDRCKIQDHALVHEPAVLEDGAFVGPAVVQTNGSFPRAVTVDGVPVEIGPWAMVGAGSTVTRDVPAFALVVGSPARRVRWVGHAGVPLEAAGEPGSWRCPATGRTYVETDGRLEVAGA